MLVVWLWLAAQLPWRLAIRLHKAIGSTCWILLAQRRRQITETIRACFPDLARSEVRRLAYRHFENLGACLAETAFAWFGKVDSSLTSFEVEGEQHVRSALASGRGVILYTGHFTPVEICGPILKQMFPLVGFMFKSRRNGLLDELQRRGRLHTGQISLPNDKVRTMIRALRQNAVVWYAPDQTYSTKGGVTLPFFGQPATVCTATCRIAKASGAVIVPFSYRRLPDESGYALRFEPPVPDGDLEDEVACTRRLVAVLEESIARCPEQYGWMASRMHKQATMPGAAAEDEDTAATAASKCEAPRGLRAMVPTLLAIVGVALFIALADNGSFLGQTLAASQADDHWLAILVSMFLLVTTSLVLVLSLSPGVRAFKFVAAALLVVGAAVGYFMSNYGIVVDVSMIRNVAETDVREASPLMTSSSLFYIVSFGIAPALVVLRLRLSSIGWKREIGVRAVSMLGSLALLSGVMYFNYGPVSFFAHEHHELRMQMNPVYPLYSLIRYLTRADDKPPPDRRPLEAHRAAAGPGSDKPVLLVFVMGETARADRFSYNGYERETNAFTRERGVVNFSHVASCGTSTADSLPCIFSQFGHDDFSHAAFAENETLFQLLGRLGVTVQWWDNSTGCKYICDPSSFVSLAGETDPDLCHENVCVDEILLEDLAAAISDETRDHFIVLHQRGSHGPAYHTDTPQWAKTYLPECDLASLRNCDLASINNAYDNTIRYTDFFLARVIALLEQESARFTVAMLYVSDHGESLGEKGLYLHGLPYSIAPAEQVEVPMVFWASGEFFRAQHLDRSCLLRRARDPLTHDAIFHTVLPIFDIQAAAYDAELDIFSPCRSRLSSGTRQMSAAILDSLANSTGSQ